MDIPFSLFFSTLQEKSILKFSLKYKNNPAAHYYILMKKKDSLLLFTCCTSQFETVYKYIESRNLAYETLVYIKDDHDNPFTKNTYINCNSPETVSYITLEKLYQNNELEFKGVLSDYYYDLIVDGIGKSRLVDKETKDLFK